MGFSLLATASCPNREPTQPPNQWVPGALIPGVKRPGRVAGHLPQSSPEIKNTWSYLRLHDIVLN
jgi:hypothetical protein